MFALQLLIVSLIKVCITQDAVLDSRNRFQIKLDQHSAYHQTYLVEINMADFIQDWSTFFLYHSSQGKQIIDFEFSLVNKHYPDKEGHLVSKCKVEDSKKPFCKAQMQNINFQSFLIKLSLDCITNCKANITIGFTNRAWDGLSAPQVLGSPLSISGLQKNNQEKNQKHIILFKILGMMGLTLILVLLAIRLGEKIASYYDKKVQKDRLDSLKEKPYMTSTQIKKNQ